MMLETRSLRLMIAFFVCAVLAGAQPFHDDFTDTTLDPAWMIQPGIGTYSLTQHPGFLRYNLAGSTHPAGDAVALWVFRPFSGTDWTLETRVSYSLPFGNGRQFFLRIPLGDLSQRGVTEVVWFRTSDQAGGGPAAGEFVVFTLDGDTGDGATIV